MGGMDKYIHIKSDDELKAALAESAKRHMRKETDEARYLLMKALGLLIEEDVPPYRIRAIPPQKKNGGDGP